MDNLDIIQYSPDQQQEIDEGLEKGLDISYYQRPEYLAIQMREIRMGLEAGVDVSIYASEAYDWFQMKEIRLGLEEELNVSKYADPRIPFEVMHQIRKGLRDGIDLSFAKTIPAGILNELREAMVSKIDIRPYIMDGYIEEQLREIRIALKKGIDIASHIKRSYRGASIREITLGLEKGLDVSMYEKDCFSWQQMREIRLGMEEGVDVSKYTNPLYSWQQMQEIRLGMMDDLPVNQYSSLMYTARVMAERRQKLLAERHQCPEAQEEELYRDFSLLLSADKMEAFILVAEKRVRLRKDRLLLSLKEKGVKTGIDYEMLERLEKQGADSNMIILASGRRPEAGKDGWYEFFFDINFKKEPKLLEDGSVDYQNIKWFELVHKGDVVAKYHEPELGIPGMNILGEEVPAKKGRELKRLICKGVNFDPDQNSYIASSDGKIEYKGDRLEVTDILILDAVTQATGNVQFNGSVYVRGEVGDGAVIRARKDILVDGFIEGATLEAGGDIILRKGNNSGGKGTLRANGSIMGRFFERANVKAGRHINANYCLNSELWAGGRVEIAGKNGILAGGSTYATWGINAFDIGNPVGIRTDLSVGGDNPYTQEIARIESKMSESRRELQLLQNAYADFKRKYTAEERNDNPLFLKIEDSIYSKNREISQLYKRQTELQKERDKVEHVKIVIRGDLYPGVRVNINGSRWNAKPAKNVTLKKKDGAVAVFRNV